MTYVSDAPAEFARQALEGFCNAHAGDVRPVNGGVARRAPGPAGKVALVVGGGSGHYPAFIGYVGEGLADAAVPGDVFASPSTSNIVDVARAVAGGSGAVLLFGNYTGDVLNFDAAARELGDAGIPAVTVPVTDDVASAPPERAHERRGIAGDVIVMKLAGAAAEAGGSLDEVTGVARHANSRLRSLGVAFGGCTLPGDDEPLFRVPAGQMAIGLGIHGEPGIAERETASASELAGLLVERLLAECPDARETRVAAVLNGLGATKYEELFVLWQRVSGLLRDAGLDVIEPICDELVTSLDMAGCSLSLCWLDDTLEPLWRAEAWSPALKRRASSAATGDGDEGAGPGAEAIAIAEGSPRSRAAAGELVTALEAVAAAFADAEQDLARLDSHAGDGDHGRGMEAGASAAREAAAAAYAGGAGVRTTLRAAADAWGARAGGTSGFLWGRALGAAADALSDATAPAAGDVVIAVTAARDELTAAGGAQVGDKTLVDAVAPFAETLSTEVAAGTAPAVAWLRASAAADAAAQETSTLTPRLGRAKTLPERSLGHPDPGAVSAALGLRAAGRALTESGEHDG